MNILSSGCMVLLRILHLANIVCLLTAAFQALHDACDMRLMQNL